jgi:hypothetical protein
MRAFRKQRRERLRQEWREVSLLVLLIVALALWVVRSSFAQTLGAALLGGAITLLLMGWLLGFDARSLRWVWGAAGEQWTAGELERLGPEWRVVHDIPDGRFNWDHVVVGRTGVYVVDSKNLAEPARVDSNGLRAGRLRYGGAAARRAAARVKEAIEEESGRAVWVQAVVVVWGDLDSGPVERDRVLYVPGPALGETLSSRPTRLSEADVAAVAATLEAIAEARVAPRAPRDTLSSVARLRSGHGVRHR